MLSKPRTCLAGSPLHIWWENCTCQCISILVIIFVFQYSYIHIKTVVFRYFIIHVKLVWLLRHFFGIHECTTTHYILANVYYTWHDMTQHACPSQYLMFSINKLTRYCLLICCCWTSNFCAFVRGNHAGSALKNIYTVIWLWPFANSDQMWSWYTGISLGMHPANERRRYIVTTSLIGWAHTSTDPWVYLEELKSCDLCRALKWRLFNWTLAYEDVKLIND